jgi:hypothetical protein
MIPPQLAKGNFKNIAIFEKSLPPPKKNIHQNHEKRIAISKIHATMKLRYIYNVQHKQEYLEV